LMGHSRILMAASKKLIMKKASSKFPCWFLVVQHRLNWILRKSKKINFL
jgi:hypothetical protein